MSRLEYVILQQLYDEQAVNKVGAIAIKELKLEEVFGCSTSWIQKQMKKLVLSGLILEGLKDGNSKTYYLSEQALKELERKE